MSSINLAGWYILHAGVKADSSLQRESRAYLIERTNLLSASVFSRPQTAPKDLSQGNHTGSGLMVASRNKETYNNTCSNLKFTGSGWIINSICVGIDDHPSSSALPSLYSTIYKAEPEENFALNGDQKVMEKEYPLSEIFSDDVAESMNVTSYQRDATFKTARKHSQGVWNLLLYFMQVSLLSHEISWRK